MSEAPPFWWQKPGPLAWALSPISGVYGSLSARRMAAPPRDFVDVPVFCVGNFIAGGAGKTPTAIAIAEAAAHQRLRPGFLSRGYGGSITAATEVDVKIHNSRDVGDESLLLADRFPTVIAADKGSAAELLVDLGVDFIVMDDGFQNPKLQKDFSLVVVDARRGIGNGFAIPAGPMRARLSTQLLRASAVLIIGDAPGASTIIRAAARRALPILEAHQKTLQPEQFAGLRTLAFAGIADPQKFYTSLEEAGAEIVEKRSFDDHHPLSDEECEDLLQMAESRKLQLVTTEKDAARLRKSGEIQTHLFQKSKILKIELEFEDNRSVERMISRTIEAAREARLARAAIQPEPERRAG